MKKKRRHDRFIRRLETEFAADNKHYRGISSVLSMSGLFIRTQHAFVPDTLVDIVMHLPDTTGVKLKGRVKYSINTPVVSVKNGMGIEITENDPQYINFVKTVFPHAQAGPVTEGPQLDTSFYKHIDETMQTEAQPPEFTIITCPGCGVKNKALNAKLTLGTKCGKCRSPLTVQA